ncbi:MAG: hypothetical protein JWP27_234 [Flaviaesturariibacter sp.]|nr:hypothetical protein [Flaviaesturariibacter sp.]
MKPKTINTLYWTFTILFSALMIFSAWASVLVTDDSVKIIHDMLGYPVYFIPFTGWAKLVGSLALFIPGYGRIKEWAYAGLFFDLIAAVYSGIAASHSFDPMMLTLLIWFVPGILSYIFWHKKRKLAAGMLVVPASRREVSLAD